MGARRLIASLSATALAAIAVAGCGGTSSNGVEEKNAHGIVTTSLRTAEQAHAVHVTGTITESGQQGTLDLRILRGTGGTGKVTFSEGGSQAQFEFTQVNGTLYLKGSSGFWEQSGGMSSEEAQQIQDKWIEAPSGSGGLGSFEQLTEIQGLFKQLGAEAGNNLQKGTTSTIEGQDVITVKDNSKHSTLFVATTGKPYPVKIVKTGEEAGTIKFESWDESFSINAPPSSQTITLQELEAGEF